MDKWGVRKDAVEWVQRSNLFELCRAWASSAKPTMGCHAGCKNREIKKWKNYLSWQLTTTNNLRPYHYEPTTLSLRTYDLITTNPRSTKGRVKEHLWVRPRWVYGWDTNTCMGETPTPVWVRYLDSRGRANGKWQDRFSANPNGAPWVIWNKIGWKCVMLRVIPN